MTITLDNTHILDLPVLGAPMVGTMVGSRDICRPAAFTFFTETLGVSSGEVGPHLDDNRCLKLDWLREKFETTVETDSDVRKEYCARAYLLYVIDCCMCPNKTENKVGVYHLQLLRDLGRVREFSWGPGILAWLFKELGLVSRCGIKSFTGYMTLLQVWIYEHFPSLRKYSCVRGFTMSMPLVCKYEHMIVKKEQTRELQLLRECIDESRQSMLFGTH